jgi:hypothetical protein
MLKQRRSARASLPEVRPDTSLPIFPLVQQFVYARFPLGKRFPAQADTHRIRNFAQSLKYIPASLRVAPSELHLNMPAQDSPFIQCHFVSVDSRSSPRSSRLPHTTYHPPSFVSPFLAERRIDEITGILSRAMTVASSPAQGGRQ